MAEFSVMPYTITYESRIYAKYTFIIVNENGWVK